MRDGKGITTPLNFTPPHKDVHILLQHHTPLDSTYVPPVLLLRYRDALTSALETKSAEVVVSVLEELSARDGLDNALGGRDAVSLTALLRFVSRHIAEPRYGKLMCGVTHRLLDLYASVVGVSPQVDGRLTVLRDKAWEEIRLQAALMEIQGCLEPVLSASLASLTL